MSGTARSAFVLLLCAPALVWSAELLAGTPPLILFAAIAPAVVLAALVIAAQRSSGRSAPTLAFAFAWGAVVAAWISTTGNELARSWIDARSNGDDRVLTAVFVAPLLEEAAKALGLVVLLLLRERPLRDARDGIVFGALVGIGFVLTENLLYLGIAMLQGGETGLVQALYLRGVLGAAMHAVLTASAGAGIGWAAAHGRRAVAAAGFAAALAQHVLWNGFGAAAVARALCGAGPVCLDAPTTLAVYGEATIITLGCLAPGMAALFATWRRSSPPHSDESA
jgi:RsiW-degrading membrane proteinase PrsW (M82 family)